jgi:hypothetical protein
MKTVTAERIVNRVNEDDEKIAEGRFSGQSKPLKALD